MKTNITAKWPFPTGQKPEAFEIVQELSLIDKAQLLGVKLVHIKSDTNPKGGLTVAFKKISPFNSGRMVEVAVATCSIEDTFSRKIGTQIALTNFFEDKTINLPLANYCSEADLPHIVKAAFNSLYSEISW